MGYTLKELRRELIQRKNSGWNTMRIVAWQDGLIQSIAEFDLGETRYTYGALRSRDRLSSFIVKFYEEVKNFDLTFEKVEKE